MAQKQEKILIAAASDLRFALDSILETYPQNRDIEVIYGSSGKFFEQISKGAPFDIYFSADMIYPKRLEEKGKTSSEIYAYGIGRLVVWTKNPNKGKLSLELLNNPEIKKIAIANPKHAPYGQRAVEVLEYYKLYDKVKSKLVFGDNISQAAQFVSSGAADVGIIALSLALSPNMHRFNADYFLIPEHAHNPLLQGAVLTMAGKDKEKAKAFFAFFKGEAPNQILSHFGFTKP